MKIKFFQLSSILILFIGILFPPLKAIAYDDYAFLFFKIDKESFMNPDYLYLDLNFDSQNKNFNAGNINVAFDPKKIELLSSEKDNSFCEFFAKEEVDNTKGRYQLACGNPNAQNGEKNITRLVFKKLDKGFTKISYLDNSSMQSSNGLGTDLSLERQSNNIYLVKLLKIL